MSNVMTNDECTFERIYLYTRFERFWHWVQGAFVVLLASPDMRFTLGTTCSDSKGLWSGTISWESHGWSSTRSLSSGT